MTGWFLIGAAAGEEVRRELVLLSEWPDWVRITVGVLAVVILLMTVWNVRQARPKWHRALLVGLRVGLLALLAVLFLEPAVREERVAVDRNHVIVLVDTSRSMATPQGDTPRIELARRFVTGYDRFWEALGVGSDVVFYRFAKGIESFEKKDAAEAIVATGERTDLAGALKDLAERYRGRDIGAIILLSDGIDNGAIAKRMGDARTLDEETLRLVKGFDAPFFTFGVSGATGLRDIAVESLRAGEFAFHLNRTSVEARVRVVGYEEGSLHLTMYADGKEIGRQMLAISPEREIVDVAFPVTPRALGEHVYTVVATPIEGEVTTQNNARSAVVRVLRDRIRVLQIAGHPSWDVRFLRNYLKRNPNIDLISFFILVNTANLLAANPNETSLIPFPAKELFVDELGGFDLVILQDFNYGPFSTRQHLHRVRDFVRQGGALLMIGGRLAFSAGGYDGTAITEVLPVALPPGEVAERTLSTRTFRPQLTEAGLRHPVFQLGLDEEETRAIWEALPPLEGTNLFDGTSPSGLALAVHPDLRYRGAPRPVVAVGEIGEGRSAVFGSDSSWFWGFVAAGRGGDPHVYDRFWNNVIRWLIRDPALDLVQVTSDTERLTLGDHLRGRVEVREPDYRPAAGEPVDVQVWRRASGTPGDMEELVHQMREGQTDEQGLLQVDFTPTRAGVYEIVARAEVGGIMREGRDLLAVEDMDPEAAAVVPVAPVMEQLAAASGGLFAPLDGAPVAIPTRPTRALEVTERRFHDVWTSPWLLLAAILLFGSEWWLRRRWGYL